MKGACGRACILYVMYGVLFFNLNGREGIEMDRKFSKSSHLKVLVYCWLIKSWHCKVKENKIGF